jgi:HEAT repeat protein
MNDALSTAWEKLRSYDYGSARGGLQPIDEAVMKCLDDPPAQQQLEQRLLEALAASGAVPAQEYICDKLGLMGTAASVPALARLLERAEAQEAARRALAAMPHPEARQALRRSVRRLSGRAKIGVVHCLGEAGDAASVRLLSRLLADPDLAVAAAAAYALGKQRTASAGKVLRQRLPRSGSPLREAILDACLECAFSLARGKDPTEAEALYRAVLESRPPKHVREAAERCQARA